MRFSSTGDRTALSPAGVGVGVGRDARNGLGRRARRTVALFFCATLPFSVEPVEPVELVAQDRPPRESALSIEVVRDNSPIYAAAERDAQKIVYTVHRGERFEVLEKRLSPVSSLPFYRVGYGQRGDTGWIHADNVAIREGAAAAGAQSGTDERPAEALYPAIRRLVEAYNEEKSQLTAAYGLRPFPSFALGAAGEALLYTADGALQVPLTYASPGRKLNLPRADKFLFQLILAECFRLSRAPQSVALEIQFEGEARPLRLAYRLEDWVQHGKEDLEAFWTYVVSEEKANLWG